MVKNKLFLFGGFDEEIISTNSIFHTSNLTPTPAGLATWLACFPGSQNLAIFSSKFGPFAISGGNPFHDVNPITAHCAHWSEPSARLPQREFGGVSRILQTPSISSTSSTALTTRLGNDTLMARYHLQPWQQLQP